jgi:hypothetical protein
MTPFIAKLVFAVGFGMYLLGWYLLGCSRAVLAQSTDVLNRAKYFHDEANARSESISRMLSQYADHAKAFEQYEFGAAMRANAVMREKDRES